MKPISCKKAEKALTKLGFVESKQKATSHRQFKAVRDEKLFKVTLDCHNNEVSANNLRSMIKQSGFSKKVFLKSAE